MPQQGPISPIGQMRLLEFSPSLSLEAVAPFEVMLITGSARPGPGRTVFDTKKYDDDGHPSLVLFNGPVPVPSTTNGFGTMDSPCFASYDDADVPAVGAEWGPKSGSRKLHKGYPGFTILGGATTAADGTKIVRVFRTSGELIRKFELTATLTAGGNASAKFINEDDDSDGDALTVYDKINTFTGESGAQGYAKWSAVALKWLIIQLACPAEE